MNVAWNPQTLAAIIAAAAALLTLAIQLIAQNKNNRTIEKLKAQLQASNATSQEILKSALALDSKLKDQQCEALKEVVDATQAFKLRIREVKEEASRDKPSKTRLRELLEKARIAQHAANEAYSRNQVMLPLVTMDIAHDLLRPAGRLVNCTELDLEQGALGKIILSDQFSDQLAWYEEHHMKLRDDARRAVGGFVTGLSDPLRGREL